MLTSNNNLTEPTPAKLCAIFAMDENGGIGNNGALPWPSMIEDMRRFSRLTRGAMVIMGRATWDSKDMLRPLPNRLNVVITNSPLGPNTDKDVIAAAGSIEIILDVIGNRYPYSRIWIIGGSNILYQTSKFVDQIWLTRVPGVFDCDTVIDIEKVMGGKIGVSEHKHFEKIYSDFSGTEYNVINEVWGRKAE